MANRDPEEEGAESGELDRRLAASVAALPRELAPPRDLWPGVAARLPLAAPAEQPAASRPAAPAAPIPFPRRPAFWRQVAAALGSAAAGALITYAALGGGRGAEPVAAAPAPTGSVLPASFEEAPAAPLAPSAADYRLIEADYLRAKEALWISVYSRRSQFSPSTLQAVEKNFAIIDQAIFDLRRALSADPGNRRLEEELYRNHRRGLDLLRRLADTT